MLLILGEIREGKVVITIRDNGVGMDEETLKHILEKKPEPKEKQRKKTSHVGVYNVQNRLQLYYGKEYGLPYVSCPLPQRGSLKMLIFGAQKVRPL